MSTTTLQPAEASEAGNKHPLFDIEDELGRLSALRRIVGHMAETADEIGPDDMHYISRAIHDHRERLEAAWTEAWEQRRARQAAHEAELAAMEAKLDATPQAAVRRLTALRNVLRSAATVLLEEVEKTEPGGLEDARPDLTLQPPPAGK